MSEDVDVLMPDTDESAKRTRPNPPVSDDILLSKKAELLRTIEAEIAEGFVPETILENLEALEKLDRAIGGNAVAASGSMREAYCAVALECSVKLLVAGGGIPGLKYMSAFDRIWRGRIAELERLGESGLVTAEIKEWWDELQASFWDKNAREKLCGMNTRNEAVNRVRFYLEEEGESMSFLFLECGDELVKGSEGVELEGLRLRNSGKESSFKDSGEVSDKAVALPDNMNEEICEEDRVKDLEIGASASISKSLPAHEVNELEKEVGASSSMLQTVVAKPSPKTLLGAEIIVSLSTEKTNRKATLENQSEKEVDKANQTVCKSTNQPDRFLKTIDVEIVNPSCENRSNVPRLSLMERNRTACNYEWDEPIHDSPKTTANNEKGIYRPSPKIKAVDPPLENNGAQKISGRRRSRRWSLHEEETLRTAVKRCGRHWKAILNSYSKEFDERTEVDLKDKWRNMMKYSHH